MLLENILSYIYYVILSSSFLLSLSVYLNKNAPYYLRYFPPFLLITIVMEAIGYIVGHKYGGNQAIFSFFSILEYSFYFFILRQFFLTGKIRRIISYAIWIYPSMALINVFFFFFYQLTTGATYGHMSGAILVIFFCANYYNQLLRSSPNLKLLKHPPFWICTGLIFFYGAMLPFLGILNYAFKFTDKELVVFLVALNVTNYVLYSSFAIAFFCGAKYGNLAEPIAEV